MAWLFLQELNANTSRPLCERLFSGGDEVDVPIPAGLDNPSANDAVVESQRVGQRESRRHGCRARQMTRRTRQEVHDPDRRTGFDHQPPFADTFAQRASNTSLPDSSSCAVNVLVCPAGTARPTSLPGAAPSTPRDCHLRHPGPRFCNRNWRRWARKSVKLAATAIRHLGLARSSPDV